MIQACISIFRTRWQHSAVLKEMQTCKRSHVTCLKNIGLSITLACFIIGIYLYVDSVECQKFKIAFEYRYPHRLKYLEYGTYVSIMNDVYEKHFHSISPISSCHGNASLVIVVKSAVQNFGRRQTIRQTWGGDQRAFVYYSLGVDKNLHVSIINESRTFNDIIQGSFTDSYRNNILKTSLTYKWISDHCSNVKNVLLVDDDYFVNTDGVISYLKTVDTSNQMYGYRGQCWKPSRSCSDVKSFIEKEEYPFHYWPDYIIGGSVLTSTKVITKMARGIPYIKILSIDDTFVGIVAHLLKIDLIDDWRFTNTYKSPWQLAKYYLTAHEYDERTMLDTWREFKIKRI